MTDNEELKALRRVNRKGHAMLRRRGGRHRKSLVRSVIRRQAIEDMG